MDSIKKAHQIFTKHLIEQIEDNLSWRNRDLMINQAPEEAIFLGAFSEVDATHNENGMIFPNHIGIQFKINLKRIKNVANIEIDFLCDFFYRVTPSYDEQSTFLVDYYISESGYNGENRPTINQIFIKKYIGYIKNSQYLKKNLSEVSIEKLKNSLEKRISENQSIDNTIFNLKTEFDANSYEVIKTSYERFLCNEIAEVGLAIKNREIALKYRKLQVKDYPKLRLVIDPQSKIDSLIQNTLQQFNNVFNDILYQEILAINDILNTTKRPRIIDLMSESNYIQYLENSKIEDVPFPNWKIKAQVDTFYTDQSLLFDVIFSNENNVSDEKYHNIKRPYSTKLYNAQIRVNLNREEFFDDIPAFEKFDVTDLLSSYRYNVEKYGKSSNCGLYYKYFHGIDTLETKNLSIYIEKRRKTRDYKGVSLKFVDFAENTISQLENISYALDISLNEIQNYNEKFKHDEKVYKAAVKDYENLVSEINRFNFGIECIKNFSDAHKAFIYLNETFALESEFYDSWRMFQIVFIVSNIPDMIVGEYGVEELSAIRKYKVEDMVDILYFSTGGGKTEAFLGCVLFSLFFDRLRGKTKGLTAIIKYPLRLLSIQQVDRVMKKIVSAQIIKEKYQLQGDDFNLGYFVGGGNTPNSIEDYDQINDNIDDFANEYQQIYECPLCHSKVKIKVDIKEKTINHCCESEACKYHKGLPYLFIDDEIYRHVPSVLISTLDKFAVMSINNRFKALLYIDENGIPQCHDPVPTLSIIDEIHLIKESLGTFSSHYESIFYYFCSNLIKDLGVKSRKIKYMGATATISNYKYQVKELFMKDAHLFPAISPNVKKDFYSYIDEEDITRFNIAVMPFGTSPIEYILRLIRLQREIVAKYLESPQEISHLFDDKLTINEIKNILYNYYIMIQYSNTKRDASRIRNGVDAYINASSELKDIYKIPTDTILTGDTKFELVKSLLSEIARSTNPVEDAIPNYITATSMISHGVDNDKFNSIFFLGLPTLFAEYIQAYSRVGRKYSGIVYNVVRPIRVREESFLTNFNEYMEYKELLISPIPISRYSQGGLKKTFNGTLLAVLRLYVLSISKTINTLYSYKNFRELLLEIREKPLARIIKLIYSHDENEGSDFNQKINQLVKETFVFIYDTNNAKLYDRKKITNVIAIVNSTNERPMRSLRDTDHPVNIGLKEDRHG